LIIFSPALQILKNNFPDASIDMFTSYTTGRTGIFQGSKIIRKVFFFDFRKNSFWSKAVLILKLRKEKYDLVFVAGGVNYLKGSLFAFLIGGKNSAGEYRKLKLPFYSHQVRLDGNLHKIEANLNILKFLGIKAENAPRMFFEKNEGDKKFAEDLIFKNNLESKVLIGFCIGSGSSQHFKLWPNENFVELGNKILDSFSNAFLLLFCSAGEKEICLEIETALRGRAISIIGKPLSQAAALADKCRIFISSDTGLGHIVATTGADLISLFGPTIPERTGPVGPKVHIISEKCSYRYHDIFTPKYDVSRRHECLKKITPDIVLNKINQILQNGNAKAI